MDDADIVGQFLDALRTMDKAGRTLAGATESIRYLSKKTVGNAPTNEDWELAYRDGPSLAFDGEWPSVLYYIRADFDKWLGARNTTRELLPELPAAFFPQDWKAKLVRLDRDIDRIFCECFKLPAFDDGRVDHPTYLEEYMEVIQDVPNPYSYGFVDFPKSKAYMRQLLTQWTEMLLEADSFAQTMPRRKRNPEVSPPVLSNPPEENPHSNWILDEGQCRINPLTNVAILLELADNARTLATFAPETGRKLVQALAGVKYWQLHGHPENEASEAHAVRCYSANASEAKQLIHKLILLIDLHLPEARSLLQFVRSSVDLDYKSENTDWPTIAWELEGIKSLAMQKAAILQHRIALQRTPTEPIPTPGRDSRQSLRVQVEGTRIVFDGTTYDVEPHQAQWMQQIIDATLAGRKVSGAELLELLGSQGKNVTREVDRLKQMIAGLSEVLCSASGKGGGYFVKI